jgi:hypothetical protein
MEIQKEGYRLCKHCQHKNLMTPERNVAGGWKCSWCNRMNSSLPTITYSDEEVSHSTHSQYRIMCRSCHSISVVWVKKNSNSKDPECPNCGCTAYKDLSIDRINPKGDCDTVAIWGPRFSRFTGASVQITPNPPKISFICGNCGTINRYLMKRPEACRKCGRPLLTKKEI